MEEALQSSVAQPGGGEMLTQEEMDALVSRIDQRTRGRKSCVYCGNLNWFVLDLRPGSSVISLSDGRSVPVYSLGCTNCGFVRQHLRGVVDGQVKAEVDFAAA